MNEEPAGLSLSLDDMIKTQENSRRTNYGPDRRRNRFDGDSRSHHHEGNRAANNWICPGCNFECFEYRSSCIKCGHAAPVHHPSRLKQQHQHHRDYKRNQQCFLEESTGTIVFKFHNSELVRITPQGDITLNTDGHFRPQTFASLNDALNPLGIKITSISGDILAGDWSISYGKSLMRFSDGVVIPSKGTIHANRGQDMMKAFQNPLANAAKQASHDAAMKAGLMTQFGFAGNYAAPGGVSPQFGMAPQGGMWMYGGGGGRFGGRGRGRGRGGMAASPQQYQKRFTPY